MPAGTTGAIQTVDVRFIAFAVDAAVCVFKGEGVDGCCANSWLGGGSRTAGYMSTAVFVPGEGSPMDW